MESWKWAGYGNLAMLAGLGGILLSALTGIGIVDPWTNPLGWQLATAWRLGCASYLCLFFLSCAFLRWGREDTWMSRAMRSLLHVAIVLGTTRAFCIVSVIINGFLFLHFIAAVIFDRPIRTEPEVGAYG
ncbi:MAG: hypothetical protein UT02_C0002G0053 [Parcubacteria group bacterium GW2011_GWC2_38_7]|nr:MAG: hypothetical protein UT02_C0002G0053 [Parcubacteria group bacterium GW2011_GWC2_38_7]